MLYALSNWENFFFCSKCQEGRWKGMEVGIMFWANFYCISIRFWCCYLEFHSFWMICRLWKLVFVGNWTHGCRIEKLKLCYLLPTQLRGSYDIKEAVSSSLWAKTYRTVNKMDLSPLQMASLLINGTRIKFLM